MYQQSPCFSDKKIKTSGLQQQMLRFRHAFEAGTLLLRLEDRRLRWSKVMGWFAKKDGENHGILAAKNGEHVALDEQVWKLGMLAVIMRILVMKTSDFTNNLPIKMVNFCILTTEILKLCHLINKNADVPLLNQWITTAHLRYPAKTLRFPHLLFPHGKKYQAGFLDVLLSYLTISNNNPQFTYLLPTWATAALHQGAKFSRRAFPG